MRPLLVIVYGLILITGLGGCTRIQIIEEFNNEPEIIFDQMEGILFFADSVKISLKSARPAYPIRLSFTDINHNLASVSFRLTGQGEFFQDGIPIPGPSLSIGPEAIELEYLPGEAGIHTLEFVAADDFGAQGRFTLELIAFLNLPPVAVFRVGSPTDASDPGERLIDASPSFDRDHAFGGDIVGYQYSVLEKTITVEEQEIPVIFPGGGFFEVRVRVLDNDGEWSEEAKEMVRIP